MKLPNIPFSQEKCLEIIDIYLKSKNEDRKKIIKERGKALDLAFLGYGFYRDSIEKGVVDRIQIYLDYVGDMKNKDDEKPIVLRSKGFPIF